MSLKEIKARIASVRNTRKITSAMKMVSSVKLRKAQQTAQNAVPYTEQLDDIMRSLTLTEGLQEHVLFKSHESVRHISVVAFASDTSLCGGFNSNIIRFTQKLVSDLKAEWQCGITLYPIGQKMADAMAKSGLDVNFEWRGMMADRQYSDAARLTDSLIENFCNQKTDRVVLVYTHFRSAGSQQVVSEPLLPVQMPQAGTDVASVKTDFILEPSATQLLETLLPRVLRMKVHTAVLDSFASEQAARVIAMQMATDNADKLTAELTMQYNKQRQQAITNELLDLAGGSQNQ